MLDNALDDHCQSLWYHPPPRVNREPKQRWQSRFRVDVRPTFMSVAGETCCVDAQEGLSYIAHYHPCHGTLAEPAPPKPISKF